MLKHATHPKNAWVGQVSHRCNYNLSAEQEEGIVLGDSGAYKAYCNEDVYVSGKAARQTTVSRLVRLGSYLLRGKEE